MADLKIRIEVLRNGKHEAIAVNNRVVGGIWVGMGTTIKSFVVGVEDLKHAIADYERQIEESRHV